LFARSLRNLAHEALGFDREHVLTVSMDPRAAGYGVKQLPGFYRALVERVQTVPGVRSAAVAMCGLVADCRSITGGVKITDGTLELGASSMNWDGNSPIETSFTTYDTLGNPLKIDLYVTKLTSTTYEFTAYNAADAAPGGGFPYSSGPLGTTDVTISATVAPGSNPYLAMTGNPFLTLTPPEGGQIALALEQSQLQLDDPLQLVGRTRDARQLRVHVGEQPLDPMLEERDEQVVLGLEVEVDGAVGDAGRFGHLADTRQIKSLAREDAHGGVEDALALVPSPQGAHRGTTARPARAE